MKGLKGFELRGRSHLHPHFYGYSVPWGLVPGILRFRDFREPEGFEVEGWRMSVPYGIVYLRERRGWLTEYVPPRGLQGKRVLDVGAGCGESAKFFLENGALRVLCVENNVQARTRLELNARRHRGVEVVGFNFNPDAQMRIPVDFVKVDIEGYEVQLYEWLRLNPEYNVDMVVEAHSVYQRDLFASVGFVASGPDPPWGLGSSSRVMYRWKK